MEEVWKDVVGWEGFYQVSNLGRVRSVGRIVERHRYGKVFPTYREGVILAGAYTYGYRTLVLRRAGRRETRRVNRIVAEAFLPNPDNLPVVDHIDGDRGNDKVTNLRWVTWKQNANNVPEARDWKYKYYEQVLENLYLRAQLLSRA